jgi:hypothetical protein
MFVSTHRVASLKTVFFTVTALLTPKSHNAFFCYYDSVVTCNTQYQ